MIVYVKTITGENVPHENVISFNILTNCLVIKYEDEDEDGKVRPLKATYYKKHIIGYYIVGE